MFCGFGLMASNRESHLREDVAKERAWPGWRTRFFTLEKRKLGDLTVTQFLIYAMIAVGIYIGLHGWPG